jgi:hypothetical protein
MTPEDLIASLGQPEIRLGLLVLGVCLGVMVLYRMMTAINRAGERRERERLARTAETEERRYQRFFDGSYDESHDATDSVDQGQPADRPDPVVSKESGSLPGHRQSFPLDRANPPTVH